MCKIVESEQFEVVELIAALPNPKDYGEVGTTGKGTVYVGLDEAINSAILVLREKSNNCPMCILAALRQSGIIPAISIHAFDYKAEVERFWKEKNEEDRRQDDFEACH